MHAMLDVLRAAQRYDITLMLFLLPHMLLGVIVSQTAANEGKGASSSKDRSKAPTNSVHEAIVLEVLAVARLCTTGHSLDDATAAQPQAALHLQAFLGALDALQQCAQLRIPLSFPAVLPDAKKKWGSTSTHYSNLDVPIVCVLVPPEGSAMSGIGSDATR
jgi:hypothetical protein